MSKRVITLTAAALVAGGIGIAYGSSAATAAPVVNALGLKSAVANDIEAVRWGWGPGLGIGLGAGLIGGAIIGGALAAPYYYGPGPYYPAPGYYGPYPAPVPAYGPPPGYGPAPGYGAPPAAGPGGPGRDASAFCARKYKSYDPSTGTYLSNDGTRHPCP
jgi:hypothetical protein